MDIKQCKKCLNCDTKNNCTIMTKSIYDLAKEDHKDCVHFVVDSIINSIMGAIYRQISSFM